MLLLALEVPSVEPQACNCLILPGFGLGGAFNGATGPDIFHNLCLVAIFKVSVHNTPCLQDCSLPLKIEKLLVHQTKYRVGYSKSKNIVVLVLYYTY
uniref:Uncharacterized protein n=1 Tax=Aegilops tauschii subsp. strangulata TaxID=200361 RepID=A0A453HL95_AEGTS